MPLLSAGLTDIGQKRKTNQDSIYMSPPTNLFVVADGMGGHNGGDIASQMAVKVFPEYMQEKKDQEVCERIKSSVLNVNEHIRTHAAQTAELEGMGTTVVSLYFKGDTLYVGNVGDSRCYLINKKSLYQLSKDHSMVQEKINMGIYSRAQASKDPQKNILVRAVGVEQELEVDVFTYKVCRNDIFLICSDGLHGKVCDQDIARVVNELISNPISATNAHVETAAQALIDRANANGGNDNISVILVLAQ